MVNNINESDAVYFGLDSSCSLELGVDWGVRRVFKIIFNYF